MLERDLVRTLQRKLRNRGAWVIKLHGGPFQLAGLPDLLVLEDGHYYWFEVKRPDGGRLTRIQRHCHETLRKHGGIVAVVTSWAQVEEVLDAAERKRWTDEEELLNGRTYDHNRGGPGDAGESETHLPAGRGGASTPREYQSWDEAELEVSEFDNN